jgi:hypothetical protein
MGFVVGDGRYDRTVPRLDEQEADIPHTSSNKQLRAKAGLQTHLPIEGSRAVIQNSLSHPTKGRGRRPKLVLPSTRRKHRWPCRLSTDSGTSPVGGQLISLLADS